MIEHLFVVFVCILNTKIIPTLYPFKCIGSPYGVHWLDCTLKIGKGVCTEYEFTNYIQNTIIIIIFIQVISSKVFMRVESTRMSMFLYIDIQNNNHNTVVVGSTGCSLETYLGKYEKSSIKKHQYEWDQCDPLLQPCSDFQFYLSIYT